MKVEKSFIAILALLIVAAGVSAAMYFRQVNEEGSAKAKSLAMQIGQWKGEDIELSDRTYKVLEIGRAHV